MFLCIEVVSALMLLAFVKPLGLLLMDLDLCIV